MADNIKESLSALIDSEASEIELHRLLRHVDQDDLRQSWISYQQVRSVMRNEPLYSADLQLELHRRINAAVEADSEFEVKKHPHVRSNHYLKPIGGFAIAASLAFVGFVGFNQYSSINDPTVEQVVESRESDTAPDMQMTPVNDPPEPQLAGNKVLDPLIESDLQELPPEKQRRLREYLLRHDRQFEPQTRVVTFKQQQNGQ